MSDLNAPLKIRQSRRARRLALNMRPPEVIELVVPHGTSPRAVDAFIEAHRAWIERSQREMRRKYRGDTSELPTAIELPAIAAGWRLKYEAVNGDKPRLVVDRKSGMLTVNCAPDEAKRALRRWLRAQGREHLIPWLGREAKRLGLAPSSVQVRLQRTRWGSCSSRGCISLNASLLFLAAPVVSYLIVHELCHLHQMNHSTRFWRRVAKRLPNYRELDLRLADAWTDVPVWALPE